jgi:hypothetical protein
VRGVPPKIVGGPETGRRTRLREDGFKHGREGTEKRSSEPEYLTSYRRGREAREREIPPGMEGIMQRGC